MTEDSTRRLESLEEALLKLRMAVQKVLDDEESKEGGWGPDVTMVWVLKQAMAATDVLGHSEATEAVEALD